ncbi:MAG: hypothetical protein ACD_86C00003G0002 [uncultured bacterium]|nr:MAG: hypothetical protein ACD_86C00003G0002 [uncultured bacterium]
MNTRMNRQLAKLINKVELKEENSGWQRVLCPITGILTELRIPTLPNNIILEAQNPLSFATNTFKIAALPDSELDKLESSLLAGILLSLYTHNNLLDSKLSAEENNLLLQTVAKKILIASIKYFSTPSTLQLLKESRRIKKSIQAMNNDFNRLYCPMIAIQLEETAHENKGVTIQSQVHQFRMDVKQFLTPASTDEIVDSIYDEVDRINKNKLIIDKARNRADKTRSIEQKEFLREARKLRISLNDRAIISPALNNYLSLLFTGDTILTADKTLMDKAVAALKGRNNPDCNRIVTIINNPIFSPASLDELFIEESGNILDIEMAEEAEGIEIPVKKLKLSFKDMMELRIQKKKELEEKRIEEEVKEELGNYVEEEVEENYVEEVEEYNEEE